MQLQAGSTIAGNTIWHLGNLHLYDLDNGLYHRNQYKVYTEQNKPDVDSGDVLNAATVNRPNINNEVNILGNDQFTPKLKLKISNKESTITYNNNNFVLNTSDGANISFPNVTGTVITTGNYPTWSDIGGNDYLVQNGTTEIKPNNKHFTTSSSNHYILPFSNNSSKIGDTSRKFAYGYFTNLYQDQVNSNYYSSQYNDSKFITFDNQSGYTHTRISGANRQNNSDVILGYDDNSYSKTRNVVLNKPLVHSSGHVIIDSNGKLDFNDLKNNNKVDKSGDRLTGNLIFDGQTSTEIEFKTDNQRHGSIKSSTTLAGRNYSNEIQLTNQNGFVFKQNNIEIGNLKAYEFVVPNTLKTNCRLVIERNDLNNSGPPYINLINKRLDITDNSRNIDKEIGCINFLALKNGTAEQIISKIRSYLSQNNDYWFEIGHININDYSYNRFFKANSNLNVSLGNINPDSNYALTTNGKIKAWQEIDRNSNDFTVATTKWVRQTAISAIEELQRTISTSGVQTTQVTVSDKYKIHSDDKIAELKYTNNNLEITNNQDGDLYYKGRIVYDSNTVPIAQTSLSGIVQLSNEVNSTDQTKAATAYANKLSYDLANSKVQKSGDTMTGVLTINNPGSDWSRLRLGTAGGYWGLEVNPQSNTDTKLHLRYFNGSSAKFIRFNSIARDETVAYESWVARNFIEKRSYTLRDIGITDFKNTFLYNENLNDIRTPGFYGQSIQGNALLSKNYPVNEVGALYVCYAGYDGIQQEYTTYNKQKWVRNYVNNNTGWTDWVRIDQADWGKIRGKPTQFTPQSHTHPWSQITGAPVQTIRWPSWNEVTNKPDIVTTNTEQTINSQKTFTQRTTFNNWLHIQGNSGINLSGSGSAFTWSYNGNKQFTFNNGSNSNTSVLEIMDSGSLLWKSNKPAIQGASINGDYRWYLGTISNEDNNVRLVAHVGQNITFYSDKIVQNKYLETPDVYITSDKRLKKDFVKLQNSLEKIKSLNGYEYKVLHDKEYVDSVGIVAQEVLKVAPNLVKNNNDDYYNVNYNGLIAMLIEQIKELEQRVQKLEKRKIFGLF